MDKKKTIEQKVVKFILDKKLISRKDRILIALSGGPDSVFLLEILNKYKKRFDIRLGAFHLDHNLRGKASQGDKEFCEALAVKYRIPFFSSSKKVMLYAKKNKMSIEEAGRELRYKELIRTAKQKGYSKIATGHNLDDNAETMLLNFIKGTGLNGLSGIFEIRDNIIRPILPLSKKEILDYLHNNKLDYRIDSSNLKSDYQRNFLRNEIIPLIRQKLNPRFDNAVLKTSGIIRNISSFINEEVEKHLNDSTIYKNGRLIINCENLKTQNENLIGSFFQNALKKYFSIEPEQKNITDLKNLLGKQTGRKINLIEEITVVKERNSIIIFKEKPGESIDENIHLKIGDKKKIGNSVISISKVNRSQINYRNSPKKEYVDAEKINGSLLVRKWETGERFHPLGMKQSKKVSDFLNEQKIPSHTKKKQLVLTESGKIVWIIGIRIDNRYALTEKTSKVVELCLN